MSQRKKNVHLMGLKTGTGTDDLLTEPSKQHSHTKVSQGEKNESLNLGSNPQMTVPLTELSS